jgi:hypothetical protein
VTQVAQYQDQLKLSGIETCPDEASAAAAPGKLLTQADGDRFPDREATLGQALAKVPGSR